MQLNIWSFSLKDVNKKLKTDNNSDAYQHNEKICLTLLKPPSTSFQQLRRGKFQSICSKPEEGGCVNAVVV